ncbi:hypothetical protein SAMN04515674_101478 [Pseudarcicella hirudinis]|uniref:Uncharacterized protein n=1 Tax=Pseudarcicella hirudinis TaxID=1079859 RepID=A0A1I5MW92_9BACT|nr:hypothetical protein [Pseudarcicella hirudinis]SFP13829.1 hypothetical protein SAMN04515674_101478 [Pseudarcicella hirudinis]
MAFDSRAYDWSQLRLLHNGQELTSFTRVQYTADFDKKLQYGAGTNPQFVGIGNKSFSGSITIKKRDLIAIKARFGVKLLGDVPPFTITIAYKRPDLTVQSDSLMFCEFGGEDVSIGQGDPDTEVTANFIFLSLV